MLHASSYHGVLFWIYGGGFANRNPEFNAGFLLKTSVEISRPVIVVSINYRLNSFGSLASYQVRAEGVTNLGLRDQWGVLEWIYGNIDGFDGDTDRVISAMEEPTAHPGQKQPWREFWPPKNIETLTAEDLGTKPWLTWKPDPAKPNAKPWLGWTPRGYRHPLGRAQVRPEDIEKDVDGDASSGAEGG